MTKISTLQLPVSFLREGEQFIAYTPALDLSTSGQTFEEAQQRFTEAVDIFLAELVEMGTVEEVLLGLGWVKQQDTLVPPMIIAQELQSIKMPAY